MRKLLLFLSMRSKPACLLIAIFLSVSVMAQMSGTYTVNSASSTAGTNFQNFTDLATALNLQGVSGHVIVNVVGGSGPYTEQVVFNTIPGSSASSTVTINGNNNTIGFTTVSANRHVIRLANISWFTINDLNIAAVGATTSTPFYGVHIFSTGNNITINNVHVDMTGITSTLAGGLVTSGSETSILTAGTFSNITYSNNTTTGGGYGLTFMGTNNAGVLMNNNTIYDFSSNGIYTRGTNGAVIRDNTLNKRAGSAGANGIQLAQGDNLNASVYNNKISHHQTASATFRAIYVFGGTGHRVYNNLIHEIRAETGTAVHGIAVRAGAPEVFFNTVIFDHSVAAAQTLSAFSEDASNTGTKLRNNIFYITQTGPTRTGITLGSTSTITTAVLSNRNVFWIPGGNIAVRGATTYATLAAWQAASTQDANSFNADPAFAAGTGIPTNPTIDNTASSEAGILTDITGTLRSATPDPGAYEFPVAPCTNAVGGTIVSNTTAGCGTTTATLTATGYSTGSGSTYQWESSNDNFATNINPLSGQTNPATASTGPISSTTYFRLKVTCPSGTTTATSNTITLTITPMQVINTHPASQAVCEGSNVTFTVQATNAASYQWKKNGTDIAGETSSTYTINGATAASAGSYTVAVIGNGPCTPVISNPAVLTVNTPVSVTTAPTDQTACLGGTATFSVTALGSGVSYQWKFGTTDIPGATAPSHTINPVTAASAGNYSVVITGVCNSVTTTPVTLTVNSTDITTQPVGATKCEGESVTFTVVAPGTGVTYQWRKGTANITGATNSTYTIASVAAVDAGDYNVLVTGTCGTTTSSNATLVVNTGVSITSSPASVFSCDGGSVTFTVTATGSGLTYQWRKGTTAIAGATSSTYTINPVTAANAGDYNVVVTGTCNAATSANATLTVGAGNSWNGQTSTDWHTASNWCGGIPTSTSDIVIPSGTPFAPTISAIGSVRNITINSGANLTIPAGGRLNIAGNYVNNGTLSAAGTIAFEGASNQSVGSLNAGTIIVNGAGGITLAGNMTATTLTLTNGNITLGTNTLTLLNSTTGSAASHIITNSTGGVISNIGATAVTIPVGPNAASYNPVTLSNGGGFNYTVKVATGVNPAIANTAKAINRTWTITPASTPASNVTVALQYADADANSGATATANMEVGVHNGTQWSVVSPAGGIAPTGTATARVITYQATQFGAVVLANIGGISSPTSLPSIDLLLTQVGLYPNVVNGSSNLRIISRKTMVLEWSITDASGRNVKNTKQPVSMGINDIPFHVSSLPAGVYHLSIGAPGSSPVVIPFIRQ